jgi:GTP-binding protein Era
MRAGDSTRQSPQRNGGVNGKGRPDLMPKSADRAEETGERTRAGRVAIVGRPNVGKSTLLNALLGEPLAIISKHAQTTRDQIHGILTTNDAQYVFVDTPGLHRARHKLGTRMNAAAREAARGADVILFMTDVTEEARTKVGAEDAAILRDLPPSVPVLCVINKIDRVKEKAKLLPLLEAWGGAHDFAAIVPVSARTKNGADRILAELHDRIPEGPPLFGEGEISDKPVRFFVAEFVREQILRKTHQEVPHGVAVTVERFEEAQAGAGSKKKKGITRIDLAIHVDKESHKGIIIGARGATLKAIGTDARARVEALLGEQVHLQLWVRVTPGWYESDARLREMGYAPTSKDDS